LISWLTPDIKRLHTFIPCISDKKLLIKSTI
jgi:hypothetical protein